MKKIYLFYGLILLTLSFLIAGSSYAQLCPVGYTIPVTIQETSGNPQTNIQVRLTFDTQTPITAGEMLSDAADIRFSSDAANTIPLNFYVEPATVNTPTTQIWVLVPSLPAGGSVDVYMHYGNLNLLPASDINATFSGAFISSGNSTVSASTLNAEWFEVQAGDTVTIIGASNFVLTGKRVLIDGVLNANGMGYVAPSANSAGTGPGAGGQGSAAGYGGAGYGGNGGLGGYDGSDVPGTGGLAYGSYNGFTIEQGSSGGSVSATVKGGNGGGAIDINAQLIDVNGMISANGGDGEGPSGQNGGGGSGGGILLTADVINVTGALTANGGAGGNGNSTANDGGGGGGGGRIKAYYGSNYSLTGFTSVIGGIGGVYGNLANGENGLPGTVFDSSVAYPASTSFSFGTPVFHGAPLLLNSTPSVTCDGDIVSFTASNTGLSNYQFFVNGVSMQNGASATYGNNVQNNDTIYVYATGTTCDYEAQFVVNMLPLPEPVIIGVGNTTCNADTFSLSLSQSYVSYAWSTGSTSPNITATVDGNYCVTVESNDGCFNDTCLTVEIGYPNPIITGNTTFCEGDSTPLTVPGNYMWYFWNTGEITPTINVTSGGSYTINVVDTSGCSDSASVVVTENPAPLPTISAGGGLLSSTPGASYQWYLDGVAITGATNQTHTATTNGYYSVEVTYSNGCSRSSDERPIFTGIDENFANGVQVYPNPTHNNLVIDVKDMKDNSGVMEILDVQGKLILSRPLVKQGQSTIVNVDVSSLQNGMYLLKLKSEAGEMHTQFVKN